MSKATVMAQVATAFIDKDTRKRYDPKGPYTVYQGAQERIDALAAKGFVDPKAPIPKDKAAVLSEAEEKANAEADAKAKAAEEAKAKAEADAKASAEEEEKAKAEADAKAKATGNNKE